MANFSEWYAEYNQGKFALSSIRKPAPIFFCDLEKVRNIPQVFACFSTRPLTWATVKVLTNGRRRNIYGCVLGHKCQFALDLDILGNVVVTRTVE